MLSINRDLVTRAFDEYTASYDATDPKIDLKIKHTGRVADLSEQIAGSLSLSPHDIDLAWLIGMLHDIGRFEQLRRFNTFIDRESIDHASFGVSLLYQDHLIDRFVPQADPNDPDHRLIAFCIEWHNKYRLPEHLDERTQLFADLIRDADKIDILRVNIDTPMPEIYNVTMDEMVHARITPEVLAAFEEEHAVLHALKKNAIDSLIGHCSLSFELVYPKSRQLLDEQGYIYQLTEFPTKVPETRAALDQVRAHLERFLKN
ncbi:MAG: HD domain-containing protein [Lachnospiraceae bacterium]|nr:HD domain-containing protein [Lachnospiraceae bacterium]